MAAEVCGDSSCRGAQEAGGGQWWRPQGGRSPAPRLLARPCAAPTDPGTAWTTATKCSRHCLFFLFPIMSILYDLAFNF